MLPSLWEHLQTAEPEPGRWGGWGVGVVHHFPVNLDRGPTLRVGRAWRAEAF